MIPEHAPKRRLIAALRSTKRMETTAAKAVTTKLILNMRSCSNTYSADKSPEVISEDSRSPESFSLSLVSLLEHKSPSPFRELASDVTGEDANKGSNAPKARGIYHAVGKKTVFNLESALKTCFLFTIAHNSEGKNRHLLNKKILTTIKEPECKN